MWVLPDNNLDVCWIVVEYDDDDVVYWIASEWRAQNPHYFQKTGLWGGISSIRIWYLYSISVGRYGTVAISQNIFQTGFLEDNSSFVTICEKNKIFLVEIVDGWQIYVKYDSSLCRWEVDREKNPNRLYSKSSKSCVGGRGQLVRSAYSTVIGEVIKLCCKNQQMKCSIHWIFYIKIIVVSSPIIV